MVQQISNATKKRWNREKYSNDESTARFSIRFTTERTLQAYNTNRFSTVFMHVSSSWVLTTDVWQLSAIGAMLHSPTLLLLQTFGVSSNNYFSVASELMQIFRTRQIGVSPNFASKIIIQNLFSSDVFVVAFWPPHEFLNEHKMWETFNGNRALFLFVLVFGKISRFNVSANGRSIQIEICAWYWLEKFFQPSCGPSKSVW